MPAVRFIAPLRSAIELDMDMVAVLNGLMAYLVRLGAKPLQHGIETLTRPWKQVTKMVDGSPIVTRSDALISRLKLLALGLRLYESGQLLLVIEPIAQDISHGRVA